MTYQIPSGAYPRNWTSPPDPLPERQVAVQLMGGMEIHFEKSMDPYDEDHVRDAMYEVLKEVSEIAVQKGVCMSIQFDIDSLEDWDVYPEYLPEEMEEPA